MNPETKMLVWSQSIGVDEAYRIEVYDTKDDYDDFSHYYHARYHVPGKEKPIKVRVCVDYVDDYPEGVKEQTIAQLTKKICREIGNGKLYLRPGIKHLLALTTNPVFQSYIVKGINSQPD